MSSSIRNRVDRKRNEYWMDPEMNAITDITRPTATADIVNLRPGALSRSLFLGEPHLVPEGLNLNWLIRESCHSHWWNLAAGMGLRPSDLQDVDGNRVFSSITNLRITGPQEKFHEDDGVSITMITPPSAANGWRSRTILSSEHLHSMKIDLVTGFARQGDQLNTQLTRAEMPPELRAIRNTAHSKTTDDMRKRARAWRTLAKADPRSPMISFDMAPEGDMNGAGLVYFANFNDYFARAEANIMPETATGLTFESREIHYFGNINAGDKLDVVSEAKASAIAPNSEARIRSHASRRSDGAVIAVCDTVMSRGA